MNTAKRFLTRLTAVTLAICVTFLCSCVPKKIEVEEYPGFEPAEETSTEKTTEEKTIPVEDIEEKGGMTDKEFEDFIAIPDPFEETGKFQFCPDAIPDFYARRYRENPKIIYVAKQMMKAVYNCKTEFEIPPEYELDIEEWWTAINLARMSCPLIDACSVGPSFDEDSLHYYVTYMPKTVMSFNEEGEIDEENYTELDEVEASKMVNDYTDFVQTIIDNNVTKDDSDIEKAEKIYKALIKEISCREKNPYEDQTVFDSMEEIVEAYNNQTTIVEDIIYEKCSNQSRIAFFYQYILTQLNIECMTVTSSGGYINQGIEKLDKAMGSDGRNIWNVIVVNGNPYNCDLAFDMFTYEYEKSENPDYEPELKYFGMSDSTRAESFNVINRDTLFLYDPSVNYEWDNPPRDMVPECPKDYK